MIGTHSGKFHCDEALACFMLKQLPAFKDYRIVRTRDPEVLKTCDVVVDVGGVHDHATRRYDHHQKEFTETMSSLGLLPFNTRLSSAGLVFAHYGKQVIANRLGIKEDDKMVSIFFHRIYETFIEEVDAVDNGIPAFDGLPRYHMGGGRSGRVGHLNPAWNEKNVNPDERFIKASELVGNELLEAIDYLAKVWWPAREIVEKAIDGRLENDPSGRIISLSDSGGVPWKEHFFELEEERGLLDLNIAYIVFGEGSDWRVQGIPKSRLSTFDQRISLPKAWCGLRDAALAEAAGIEGCVFVHLTGFIGGNRTKEGALQMAREALRIGSKEEEQQKEQATNGGAKEGSTEEGEVKKMKLQETAA